jgi:hypothetical protein
MPFLPGTVVDVEQVDDKNWKLLQEIEYAGNTDSFTAPEGMVTDFASVPRVFVWLLPRYGHYTPAAIIHDYLWRLAVPAGKLSLHDADGLFRRIMKELGVPFLQRWVMWSAVRWGALMKGGLGQADWWRDLPKNLLISIVVLPIVAPTGLLVALSIGLFLLLEGVLWGPLRVGREIRKLFKLPPKVVNAPKLSWKL